MPGSWFVKPPALAKLIEHVLVCHEKCSVKGAKAQAPSHLCPGQARVEKGVKVIGLGKGDLWRAVVWLQRSVRKHR